MKIIQWGTIIPQIVNENIRIAFPIMFLSETIVNFPTYIGNAKNILMAIYKDAFFIRSSVVENNYIVWIAIGY